MNSNVSYTLCGMKSLFKNVSDRKDVQKTDLCLINTEKKCNKKERSLVLVIFYNKMKLNFFFSSAHKISKYCRTFIISIK